MIFRQLEQNEQIRKRLDKIEKDQNLNRQNMDSLWNLLGEHESDIAHLKKNTLLMVKTEESEESQ